MTSATRQPGARLQKVHVVFKTHLDIGFTDFAEKVKARYFARYIPHAIELARNLRESAGPDRYVWTTGSWLIYEYLEHASPVDRKRLEQAIVDGDIAWHGLPFSVHSELMDPALFRSGLGISRELDRRFGKKTIAAKMTDVPGHTRGIVPLLAEAGTRLLHVGVNPGSTPPDVPPAFVWRADDGSEVIVVYQKGGYGGVSAPAGRTALAIEHTNDNVGPHSRHQVAEILGRLRDEHPDTEVVASTLSAFARELLREEPDLPVVTQELGDTWVHGVGTDPTKMRRFRELCRLHSEWLADGSSRTEPGRFAEFSRSLIMVPEHTWGLDVKTHLADRENYAAADFARVRGRPSFRKMEASWAEQRAYVDAAVAALGDSPKAELARDRLRLSEPAVPETDGMARVEEVSRPIETDHFLIRFDPESGAVSTLRDMSSGRNWAGAANLLGRLTYEVFSQQDYDRYLDQYQYPDERWDWFVNDFSKPGLASASGEHRSWSPSLRAMWSSRDASGVHFVLKLEAPQESRGRYGCPGTFYMIVDCPDDEKAVLFDARWFDKNPCRVPEALWLSFNPRVRGTKGWELDKMGQWVSPLDVVRNGNRKLHAVVAGVRHREGNERLTIESLDAPLVAPGEPSLLNFNNRQPPLRNGMHFNLYNNVWGTNFPMWFQDDARFRFALRW